MKHILYLLIIASLLSALQVNISGCAQILTPTGGPRDTIPPKLVNANPTERTTNFNGKTITLNFDEYIQLDQIQENVVVSPLPKRTPNIDYKLKTITIKLRDILIPNTTYSINFGNAIKDLNEGNPFRKYTYVFSTGSYIDSLSYRGSVLLAETGRADSTLQVYLYKNAPDSAVETRRPDYIAKVDSSGNFKFNYLPPATYKVYALKDADGSKSYNSKTEIFGFLSNPLVLDNKSRSDTLFAYGEERERPKNTPIAVKAKPAKDLKLKYTVASPPASQDLLNPYQLVFNEPLKNLDKVKLILMDTSYHAFKMDSVTLDSTAKIVNLYAPWEEDNYYKLLVPKELASDSSGNSLLRSDTIKFHSRKKSEYGSLKLNFKNLNIADHPVLQFVLNNVIVKSYKLVSPVWYMELIEPNEYEVRILFDTNNNGIWDPGNYHLKRQPERVITIKRKFTVRPNFDNEFDIEL